MLRTSLQRYVRAQSVASASASASASSLKFAPSTLRHPEHLTNVTRRSFFNFASLFGWGKSEPEKEEPKTPSVPQPKPKVEIKPKPKPVYDLTGIDIKDPREGLFEGSVKVGGTTHSFQIGRLGSLASGNVVARAGNSVVLTTAVSDSFYEEGKDFLPLMVDFREKYYASGTIPQTAHRREMFGDIEVLKSRIIDRVVRPLFPPDYYNGTQIICTVQAYDQENDPVVVAVNSASVALCTSDIPWNGPVGCVRVGEIDGELVLNPTMKQQEVSTLDILYAGTKDKSLMIEADGSQIPEDRVIEALRFAHDAVRDIVKAQEELVSKTGKPKRSYKKDIQEDTAEIEKFIREKGFVKAKEVFNNGKDTKGMRSKRQGELYKELSALSLEEFPESSKKARDTIIHSIMQEAFRANILESTRCDGRDATKIRPLQVETDVLPVVHGSSIFARGDTQVLCTVTLGSQDDFQVLRSASGKDLKRAMLHYEFPPYCVNETGRIGGVNRRMIGHGALAEKAIVPILPDLEDFPYAIRMTSEVTGSDGSSSMATVAGVNMALMDAGVPIKSPVAGVSVGLITEGDPYDSNKNMDNYKLLTDILGIEDHFGDMDFKLAGSRSGITAIQLDVKLPGIPLDILCKGIHQGRDARVRILNAMQSQLDSPRDSLKGTAPLVKMIDIDVGDIGSLIGPGGANIREIESITGCNVSVDDEGKVKVYGKIPGNVADAIDMIAAKTFSFKEGNAYKVKVKSVLDFGCIVEENNQEGFIHISEFRHERVESLSDVAKVGDTLDVKCIDSGRNGKGVKLSVKATLPAPVSSETEPKKTLPSTRIMPDSNSSRRHHRRSRHSHSNSNRSPNHSKK